MTSSGERLEQAFGEAAPVHYAWQTRGSYVAERERQLVRRAFLPLGKRVLDLGCGEGATLFHLGAPEGAVGVDLFEKKLELARRELPTCRFVAAGADDLPFDDGSFDQVIVRDLVHHLETPSHTIDECARVLETGGRIDVLEPCRYNPLIVAHALAIPAERGELRSSPSFVQRLVARRFRVLERHTYQALPLHRVLFHPELGSTRLAELHAMRRLVAAAEGLFDRFMPWWGRAYVHVRGEKP